jgi:SWI/SNF-related matrix-associated actin-dependent regulator of chromatin subfamily A-like protein 1
LTECRANKHGIIEGKISINQSHAEHDDESEVIETILHEIAHAITPGAGHRPIWRQTALAIGSTGEEKAYCKGTVEIKDEFTAPLHIVALSGTPIKNHAGEYFPILNILHPERFHSQAQFERDFLDTYFTGYSYKIGGIKHWQTERFKELTSDFIIRFTRDEVLPDLPKIFRKNFFVELGPEVESAYKKAYIEFKEEFEGDDFGGKKSFSDQANLLAKLNRLRHITGLAKVKPLTDFVSEFLEDNERKIVLFVHHKDVGTGLFNNIKEVTNALKINPPLQLTSEMSNSQIGIQTDELFKNDKNQRIMIASTLSAGEGKNWQMCSDMIMVEHQWNPANEEQCEGRFPRPGSIAESINATYAIALGTPDEYLTEIKERKREICKKTMGNEAVTWNETSVIKELSEMLIQKGGKRWNL